MPTADSTTDPRAGERTRGEASRGARPNFLYIGAAKAGSFWLYEIFREHPEIFVPDAREVMFFDRLYHKGLDFYWRFFAKAQGFKAIGEISHDYFLEAEYAERIHASLPDVKLICCLREGVSRTLSEFLYDQTLFQYVSAAEYRRGFDIEDFAKLPRVFHLANYYENLKPFYEIFPRDRILILFFDELKADAAAFARRIFEFLGVDADFVAPSLHRRINVAREPRVRFLADLAYKSAQMLRRRGFGNLIGKVKRKSVFESLLYKPLAPGEKPRFAPEVMQRLWELYHRDDERLEELIGHPLPDAWKRPGGGSAG
jgi:hypothetical protein